MLIKSLKILPILVGTANATPILNTPKQANQNQFSMILQEDMTKQYSSGVYISPIRQYTSVQTEQVQGTGFDADVVYYTLTTGTPQPTSSPTMYTIPTNDVLMQQYAVAIKLTPHYRQMTFNYNMDFDNYFYSSAVAESIRYTWEVRTYISNSATFDPIMSLTPSDIRHQDGIMGNFQDLVLDNTNSYNYTYYEENKETGWKYELGTQNCPKYITLDRQTNIPFGMDTYIFVEVQLKANQGIPGTTYKHDLTNPIGVLLYDINLNYVYNTDPIVQEVVDVPGLMFDVLTMPFSFMSQAFNLTLFPGTPYAINVSNLLLTIIAVLIFAFVMKIIVGFIK